MTQLQANRMDRFMATTLLASLDDDIRQTVAEQLREAAVEPGTPIIRQGLKNDRLWFVQEGSVMVERSDREGRSTVLSTLQAPALFGTTTFFHNSPSNLTLRASTTLTTWSLDTQGYENLRRDDPRAAEALALEVLRVVSERFDMIHDRLIQTIGDESPRLNEWGKFRTRLFSDPLI